MDSGIQNVGWRTEVSPGGCLFSGPFDARPENGRCLEHDCCFGCGRLHRPIGSVLGQPVGPIPLKTWKGKFSTLPLTTGLGERYTARAAAEINAATVVEGLRKLGNVGAVTSLR
jgi:hypothetical protein